MSKEFSAKKPHHFSAEMGYTNVPIVIIAIEFVPWHKYMKKLLFSAVSIQNIKRHYYQGVTGGHLGMFMGK